MGRLIKNETKRYLEEQLKSQQYAGSMLFIGQKGTGKYQTALNFGRALLCQDDMTLTPCEKCSECLATSKLNHPDLIVINSEELIKITEIRELQKKLYLKPFRASHKITIINNAEKITEEAANSFLKILEEPPQDSILILIAPEKKSMLETIVSRCQVVSFGSRGEDILGTGISDDLREAIEEKNLIKLFKVAEIESKTPDTTKRILAELEVFFRNLLRQKFTENKESMKNFSEKSIIKTLEGISESLQYLENNVNRRFLLENLFINYMVEK